VQTIAPPFVYFHSIIDGYKGVLTFSDTMVLARCDGTERFSSVAGDDTARREAGQMNFMYKSREFLVDLTLEQR
jgi:hypothetical protein